MHHSPINCPSSTINLPSLTINNQLLTIIHHSINHQFTHQCFHQLTINLPIINHFLPIIEPSFGSLLPTPPGAGLRRCESEPRYLSRAAEPPGRLSARPGGGGTMERSKEGRILSGSGWWLEMMVTWLMMLIDDWWWLMVVDDDGWWWLFMIDDCWWWLMVYHGE